MSNSDIIRAWKDEEFNNSLSEAQRSELPESPVGKIELLSDEDMELLSGGTDVNITVGYYAECNITVGYGADCFNFG